MVNNAYRKGKWPRHGPWKLAQNLMRHNVLPPVKRGSFATSAIAQPHHGLLKEPLALGEGFPTG